MIDDIEAVLSFAAKFAIGMLIGTLTTFVVDPSATLSVETQMFLVPVAAISFWFGRLSK